METATLPFDARGALLAWSVPGPVWGWSDVKAGVILIANWESQMCGLIDHPSERHAMPRIERCRG